MARTITIRLPHGTSQDAAVALVKRGITKMMAKYSDKVSDVAFDWDGPRVAARCSALAQTVTSLGEITPEEIHCTVQLPFLLSPFSEKIKDFLERKLLRMFPAVAA